MDDRIFPFEGRRQWFTDEMSILRTLHSVMGIAFRRCFSRQQHSGQIAASLEGTLSDGLSDLNADDRGVQEVWQGIHLGEYGSSIITEEDKEAIVHTASQRGFQKLFINNQDWLSSEDLLVILRACPTLRVLECGYNRYPSITATDLTRRPWSSKWLKVLHLIISGISRPDIKTDARDQPIPAGTPFHTGAMEESRVLQRKVCAQLGALVCLEELCLGYSLVADMIAETDNEDSIDNDDDNDDQAVKKYNPFLQLNCLELTLESGLDLLSELKSLECFSVWGMDHRIGKKELYWMQRNWHSVRRVFGLLPLPYQGSMRHFGSDPSVLSCQVAFSIM